MAGLEKMAALKRNDESTEDLIEGSVSIPNAKGSVFYNPAQVVNRDLSVSALRVFSEMWAEENATALGARRERSRKNSAPGNPAVSIPSRAEDSMSDITVLEGLSATGLRALRYLQEVEGVKRVVANDFDPTAVEAIKRNVAHNGVSEDQVIPNVGDAAMVMLQHRDAANRFEVVDLDPYGSPSTFLDSAVQCVADGGLLCVTATDMAVLAGNHSETCFIKYGCMPIKGKYCHEMALRILLSCIAQHAGRYQRYIVPQLSFHIDFYVRVFVRVYHSPAESKKTASRLSHLYQSVGCDSFHLQPVGRVVMKANGSGSGRKEGGHKNKNKGGKKGGGEGAPEGDRVKGGKGGKGGKEGEAAAAVAEPAAEEEEVEAEGAAEAGASAGAAAAAPAAAAAAAADTNTNQNKHISYTPAVGPVVPDVCPDSKTKWKIGGPIWSDPIHDQGFITRMLASIDKHESGLAAHKRLHGYLSAARDELPDVPLYYWVSSMCSTLHCEAPPGNWLWGVIQAHGYRVSRSHCHANALKTDAPPSFLWDAMRCWVKAHPIKRQLSPTSAAAIILSQEPQVQVDVSNPHRVREGSTAFKQDTAIFLPNPEENWGPKPRAGTRAEATVAAGGAVSTGNSGQARHQMKDDLATKTDADTRSSAQATRMGRKRKRQLNQQGGEGKAEAEGGEQDEGSGEEGGDEPAAAAMEEK